MSKMAHCMRALLKLRWFKFGSKYLYQKSGTPIGGPVPGAALEAVLSIDEDPFDKFGWKKFMIKDFDGESESSEPDDDRTLSQLTSTPTSQPSH